MARMKPTHLVLLLGCTLGRATLLRARGIPAGNYEEGNFKISDMYIDGVVNAQHEAHVAYLSAAGVSSRSSDSALAAMAKAEQKLQLGSLPYTIVRSPPLMEHGGDGKLLAWKLWAQARRGLYAGLGLVGLKELAAARGPADPRSVARAMIDVAFSEGATSSVLEPHQLGL
jgi:uncharacterized protein YbjT (DUF2867 family)